MKKIFLVSLLLIAGFYGYAQVNENAIAKVHYLFKHVNDTTQPENFLRDEVVTYIGQSGSYYTSYSSTRSSEQMNAMLKDPAFDGNLTINRNTSTIRENYLFKPEEGSFQMIARLVNDTYAVDEKVPEIDWAIEEETRKIGGYTCQMATTHFKGRDYTAWFTTELPFSYGPWKLHGLPGLILEAYDTKKEVVFEYNGFDKEIGAKTITIGVPENALPVNLSEYKKQEDAYNANPQAYVNARLGSLGGTVSSTTINSSSGEGGGTIRVVAGARAVGASSGGGGIDPSKIKSINVKNDDNYKPSKNTNNPIELKP